MMSYWQIVSGAHVETRGVHFRFEGTNQATESAAFFGSTHGQVRSMRLPHASTGIVFGARTTGDLRLKGFYVEHRRPSPGVFASTTSDMRRSTSIAWSYASRDQAGSRSVALLPVADTRWPRAPCAGLAEFKTPSTCSCRFEAWRDAAQHL